jgi:glutathione S-transferase
MAEKRIPFELRLERVWERREEFLEMNPACTVPVLREENGLAVADSYAICEYLEEAYPDTGLLGGTLAERAEVRRLVAWFDGKFAAEVTSHLLYEKQLKRLLGRGNPDASAIRVGYANMRPHLEYLGWLAETRPWLAGPRISLADFAAAGHLSALDYIGDVGLEPERVREAVVRPHEVAPELPRLAGRAGQRPGAARPLRRPGFLSRPASALPPLRRRGVEFEVPPASSARPASGAEPRRALPIRRAPPHVPSAGAAPPRSSSASALSGARERACATSRSASAGPAELPLRRAAQHPGVARDGSSATAPVQVLQRLGVALHGAEGEGAVQQQGRVVRRQGQRHGRGGEGAVGVAGQHPGVARIREGAARAAGPRPLRRAKSSSRSAPRSVSPSASKGQGGAVPAPSPPPAASHPRA